MQDFQSFEDEGGLHIGFRLRPDTVVWWYLDDCNGPDYNLFPISNPSKEIAVAPRSAGSVVAFEKAKEIIREYRYY